MEFEYEMDGETLFVRLPREVDHHNCRDFKVQTQVILEEQYIRRMVFDFRNTEFMDSSGIGVLLLRYKQMRGGGGQIGYFGASGRMKRILEMAGILHQLTEYEGKKEARG